MAWGMLAGLAASMMNQEKEGVDPAAIDAFEGQVNQLAPRGQQGLLGMQGLEDEQPVYGQQRGRMSGMQDLMARLANYGQRR